MADVRVKDYDLKVDDVRQIKIVDIAAPIRFSVVSGSFTYELLVGNDVVATGAVPDGVLVAPGGCWGSELRITCATAGVLKVAHMG